MPRLTHRSTMLACYNGYITQAICINLAPLFYLTFQREYSLSLGAISFLIACNFATQLCVDFLASFFSERINLRLSSVLAHIFTVIGLFGLSLFPMLLPPYAGLLVAICFLGLGGGFTEVIISPILEACPTTEKSGNMSLLHSFYCWGQAGVVLFSGIYFYFLDVDRYWRYLPFIWAIIPLLGAVMFSIVPIYRLPRAEESGAKRTDLFRSKTFFCYLIMMFCIGASEMTMSQWASGFAESALGLEKSVGDLLGPCLFAVMMGLARVFYGRFSTRINLDRLMCFCSVLCAISYLLAALSPWAWLSFVGCAVCGLSVGIFWPGILSSASRKMPFGGIPLFALLALSGDLGCLLGPSLAGWIADAFGGELRIAFCFAILFPLSNLLFLGMEIKKEQRERQK